MLRTTAFTLLLLGVLSHPIALLCERECKMGMGANSSHESHAPLVIKADLRDCCLGSAQITKQWDGKPLPKVVQHETLSVFPHEVVPAGSYHPRGANIPWQQRGSPTASFQSQVLRV